MSRGKSLCGAWRGWALVVALCAGACGGVPEDAGEVPLPEAPDTVSAQGYERQGMRLTGLARPGYEQSGDEAGVAGVPALKGFSLSSVAGLGYTVDQAELEQGTLQVRRSVYTGSTPSLVFCFMTATGETRRCGWSSGGVGLCSPGTSVTLTTGTCNVAGQEDTMLRVCSGTTPCEYGSATMLASNDDACGSLAARATFTCPASGSFTALVAPYRSGTPLKAKPVAVGAAVYPYYNVLHTGTALNGTSLRALTRDGGSLTMRIKAVHDELPDVHPGRYGTGLTYRYEVEEQQADGQWVPLCGRDMDDELGLKAAIPVSGWWDREGRRNEDPDLFTFSCGTGVVAKCYRWGYRPWDWHSAQGTGLTPQELHQACTRMARADYCGDGNSWTQPGTPINLWDLAGIQQQAPSEPGHSFEAGWSPEGAVCLNQTRWSHTPDDVFFEGCPNLVDFWQTPYGVQRVARVCETMNEAREKSPRAALFDESAFNLFPGSAVPASY